MRWASLALLCAEFCVARLYDGGFPHKGKCYCFELVERDVPPAMGIAGIIREKSPEPAIPEPYRPSDE